MVAGMRELLGFTLFPAHFMEGADGVVLSDE